MGDRKRILEKKEEITFKKQFFLLKFRLAVSNRACYYNCIILNKIVLDIT